MNDNYELRAGSAATGTTGEEVWVDGQMLGSVTRQGARWLARPRGIGDEALRFSRKAAAEFLVSEHGAPEHHHECPWLMADNDAGVECTCHYWAGSVGGRLELIRRRAAALGADSLADRADMTREYMVVRAANALGDDALRR